MSECKGRRQIHRRKTNSESSIPYVLVSVVLMTIENALYTGILRISSQRENLLKDCGGKMSIVA